MTAGRNIVTLTKDWCTPKKYIDAVKIFFGGKIDLDPCSNKDSIVHAKIEYMLPANNGLKKTWNFPTIYVNPPYGIDKEHGTTIKDWLYKCAEANSKYDSEVLALVPVAPNTGHWKKYIFGKANSVCFLADTRLKFIINGNGDNKGAPMACAIVYWGRHNKKFYEIFSKFGAVVHITNLIENRWVSPDIKDTEMDEIRPIENWL